MDNIDFHNKKVEDMLQEALNWLKGIIAEFNRVNERIVGSNNKKRLTKNSQEATG